MKRLRALWLLLLVLPLALLSGAQRSGSWDMYFHLATGREVLRQHSRLPVDPFSFTAAGQPWIYKDLVADVLLYLGFSTLGFWAFFLLKVLCALGIARGLWLALPGVPAPPPTVLTEDPSQSARRPAPRALPWLCATGLLLAALQYRFVERPLLFSLTLFPLFLGLLQRTHERLLAPPCTARALIAAAAPPVLLVWLWLQLHREAVVGVALLLAYAAYAALAVLVRGRLPRLLATLPRCSAAAAAGMAGAVLLLCPLNPGGLTTFTSTLAVGQSEFYRQYIMDWRALPPLHLVREFPVASALTVLAALQLIVLLRRAPRPEQPPRPDLWHLGLLLLFLGLTLQSSRYLPYLASASALITVRVLPLLLQRTLLPPIRLRGALLVLVALGAAALERGASPHKLGVGPVPDHFPESAIRFALHNGLHQRVVNDVALGGYVHWAGWPQLQVSIDGRMDTVYTPEQLRRHIGAQQSERLFAALRQEDGADWVLAENEYGLESFSFLAHDPAWALIYWSEPAAIFVRRDAYPQLQGMAFRYLDSSAPFASVERAALLARQDPARLPQIEAELLRLLDGSPRGVLSRSLLVVFYHYVGPERAAQRNQLYGELLREHPDHRAVLDLPRHLR